MTCGRKHPFLMIAQHLLAINVTLAARQGKVGCRGSGVVII